MFYPNLNKINEGFTLIEVMLAMLILGVGLVGVAQMQGNSQKYSTLSKERVEAITLAQQELEQLRHFATTAEYEANITNQLSGSTNNSFTANGQTTTFTVASTITPINNGLGADILVKVSWPDRENSGSVSDNTKVYLATKVSNAVPVFFGMSEAGPVIPPPAANPPLTFPPDPTIPANKCLCNTYTASLDIESGIVKVGGGGGMGSGGSSPPPTTSECTDCCANAYAMLEDESIQYANNELNYSAPVYYDDIDVNNLEDRVINQNTFDMQYLIKGYQLPPYQKKLDLIAAGGMGTTYYEYAVCSYVQTTVSRCHHKWTE